MTDFLFLLMHDPKFLLKYSLVVAQEKVKGFLKLLSVPKLTSGLLQG